MAVEARQLNLFRPLNIGNREMILDGNGSMYGGAQISYGAVDPLSGITTTTDNTLHMYGSTLTDAVQCKPAERPVSRKRSKEAISTLLSSLPNQIDNSNRCGSFTFLGEDILSQIQLQQMEIDRFISQHTEKVRMEMEERRRRYSRRIAAAVEENVMKRLKVQEEEIEKMGKLNWALQEKVKSLSMENQLWRDLAQSNEATSNALRCDLEQVLAQVQGDNQQQHRLRRSAEAALMDDAQSCCGSNKVDEINSTADWVNQRSVDRACRRCGKEESCVLLLPCRHLCLCTVCGLSLHICPVCNSVKTASLHVNLSS